MRVYLDVLGSNIRAITRRQFVKNMVRRRVWRNLPSFSWALHLLQMQRLHDLERVGRGIGDFWRLCYNLESWNGRKAREEGTWT